MELMTVGVGGAEGGGLRFEGTIISSEVAPHS